MGLPNEIEYGHWAYRMAYWMASRETVKITTNRWSPRPHSDRYHSRRTPHGNREDYWKPYRIKPLSKMLTEWQTKGSRNFGQTAYQTEFRTEYQTTIPEAYQVTTEKPTNIPPTLPTKRVTEIPTKSAPKPSSEWLSQRSSQPRPYKMPKQEMPKSANAMYKAAFQEQKGAPITVSMTTYCMLAC